VEDADAFFKQRQTELSASGTPFLPIPYEPLGLMLYDVFDHAKREEGFRWLHDASWVENYKKNKINNDDLVVQDEVSLQEKNFEMTLTDKKRGEQNKLRKEFIATRKSWMGKLIKPQTAFFQANIENSVMRCHPSDVKILIQEKGEIYHAA
jgi:hypothetical protein